MSEISPLVLLVGGALLALFVFVVVWKIAGRLPAVAKWVVRALLVAAVIAPAAVAFLELGGGDMAMAPAPMPKSAERMDEAGAPPPEAEAEIRMREEAFERERSGTKRDRIAAEESARRDALESAAPPRIESLDESPMPPRAGPTTSGAEIPSRGGLGGATRGPAATPGSAGIETEDWTLVPVFYGTDRQRKDTEARIGYDWQRARRLELGQALVSVPKNHVEPRIERPWAIRIPYTNITLYEAAEDPAEHFTIQEIKALSREDFLALVRERIAASARFEKHALVFVHGYQTTFDNAVYRTAQIAFDLKFDGAPFLYSWPSGGTLQGYTYDRESAAQAERYLRSFLDMVVKETGATKVSVIAHSMGNQVLLRVLQDFKRTMPEGVLLSQLILAAPDVDRDSFENIVSSITGIADGITLYAAANDQALDISRRVNGGVPRAGDVPETGPIVLSGVDTIDATATSMDTLGINHAGYAENIKLLTDIGTLIRTGQRPPRARVPELEEVTTAQGPYWRYPNGP